MDRDQSWGLVRAHHCSMPLQLRWGGISSGRCHAAYWPPFPKKACL